MKEWKVSVQSLIDHIKTAIDVDDWAKEMAEELLKLQEAIPPNLMQDVKGIWNTCPKCGHILKPAIINAENPKWFFTFPKHCNECGQAVRWE